jgi:hypothetical protein
MVSVCAPIHRPSNTPPISRARAPARGVRPLVVTRACPARRVTGKGVGCIG